MTQQQFKTVMGANPSYLAATGGGKDAVRNTDTTHHPVEMVSWTDAVDFCTRLSRQEKLLSSSPKETDKGLPYRLPSEAEWEFGCRAGTTTRYWIGDEASDLPQAAWFSVNSKLRTHPVGKRKGNPFGVYDTHGNVWEWVQDWWNPTYYSQFKDKAAIDPHGPAPGETQRVIRGGYLAQPRV